MLLGTLTEPGKNDKLGIQRWWIKASLAWLNADILLLKILSHHGHWLVSTKALRWINWSLCLLPFWCITSLRCVSNVILQRLPSTSIMLQQKVASTLAQPIAALSIVSMKDGWCFLLLPSYMWPGDTHVDISLARRTLTSNATNWLRISSFRISSPRWGDKASHTQAISSNSESASKSDLYCLIQGFIRQVFVVSNSYWPNRVPR